MKQCIKKGTFTVTTSERKKHFNVKYPHTLCISLKSVVDAEPEFEISRHKPLKEVTEL